MSRIGAVSPSREEFTQKVATHRVVPVTRKVLADSETPLSAYRKLAGERDGSFLLESAPNGQSWSRWSFIGAGTSALTVVDDRAQWWGTVPAGAPVGSEVVTDRSGRAAATRSRATVTTRTDSCSTLSTMSGLVSSSP